MDMKKEEMTSLSNEAPAFFRKTISEFLAQVSNISNTSDKLLRLDHFICRLEDEMRKIDAFHKQELPLSVLLLNDAIVALKEEHIRCRNTNVEPVFQEFLLSKESYDDGKRDEGTRMDQDESGHKKNWMSSVKLWNNTSDQTCQAADHNCTSKPMSMGGIEKISDQEPEMEQRHQSYQGGAQARTSFPFKENSTFLVTATGKEEKAENKEKFPVAELSLVTSGNGIFRLEMGSSASSSKSSSSIAVSSSSSFVQSNIWTSSQRSKKQRRRWSSELHRQFVSALQQLGGSQVATAKQIRELMQVDGLTNAEVYSHLQDYRLHNRRSSTRQSLESSLNLSSALRISKEGKDSTKICSEFTSLEGPFS